MKRRIFFLISDILLLSASIYFSFWLRFNSEIPAAYQKSLIYYILLALFLKLFFLAVFNLYDISWRFVGLDNLIIVFKALALGSLSFGMILYILRVTAPFKTAPFPRSVLLIDFIISLILIGSLRIIKRVMLEGFKKSFKPGAISSKALIVGAGNAGEQLIRDILRHNHADIYPIGFIDDDPAKKGIKIHGIKVLGNRNDIPKIIQKDQVDDVLIALPSASSKDIREIVQIIRETGAVEKIKILPSTTDLIDGKVTLSDIHEIKLSDLLGRAAVHIDYKTIKDFIQDKKVLITGAGGSIGSELANAILQFNPKIMIILDIDETEVYHLMTKFRFSAGRVIPVVGDIRDKNKIASVFSQHSPEIVLHAAAYKHVPILEFYPEEALKTNLMGTKVVAELAIEHKAEKFILISTDKAINPTSIMGATKRASEELLKILNDKNITRFISVRFGNVLGSRGSVVPLFREQIQRGGPITVTHPEMKRYFMITSEAVLLVLEAAAIGEGGEVFVLDMGKQVKIVDLAKEMIKLSGYQHDRDIPIIFTQIRPGEKLYEEILSAEEGVESTKYEKLLKARDFKKQDSKVLMEKLNRLIKLSHENTNKEEIVKLLKKIIPTYTPYEDKEPKIFW